ncbi:MAG TPA: PQQ-binding-like beta-propeller repeat protein, partial [Vicinamibacterales bacterium]|nr:PQQ-binding-like beta-propeller repeat protein [Vicinamibacterales bacterium]
MVKQLSLKKAALAVAAAAALGASAQVSAQGVDTLESKLYPNYVTDDMLLNADKDHSNWLHYGKDYQSTRYSALKQVNKDNVKRLRPVWNLSFGVLEGQDSQANVVNGTVYVTTSFNKVIAADGTTGKILWKYERELPGDVFPKLCCDVVNRGVAVYKNKVYLATLDAHIVALDNQTGKAVWDKKMGDYTYAETFTIMPMALQNKIIFGTAGAEYGVRGWIKAINADTGELVWQTYTVPGPGEPGNDTWAGESWKYGGGSAWITGSYDKETNRLFWPIGNPGPDFDRHVRLGDNLFTNSNVVMNPDTGKILSYYNYTPNDPYDYDGVNEMILVDVGGKKLWLHGSRNGHVYGIDRDATVAGKAGKEHKCAWVTALQRVNWTKPLHTGNNCKPVYNWPE